MNRKLYLSGLFLAFSMLVFAQPRAGYYDSAEGKSGTVLKTALFNIIKNPDVLSYAGLWTAFKTTDSKNGKVWDMYSNCSFTFGTDQCGNYRDVCDCYNREHSFPKSWFNDASPMYSDLFHLYPTDGKVNGMRSNYPFGEVSGGATWGTGKLGSARSGLGYSGTVFEPADEYKGDFARTYFYMITCYENRVSGWSSQMLSGNGYTTWATNMLLDWHRRDPVSSKETNRNNAVEDFQDNRNPFIDYPELVEYIWGDRKGQIWNSTGTDLDNIMIEFTIVQNPAQNEIQIQTPENGLEYIIYTLNGQMLKVGSLDGTGSISATDLPNGLYLLQMQSAGKRSVQKVIINK